MMRDLAFFGKGVVPRVVAVRFVTPFAVGTAVCTQRVVGSTGGSADDEIASPCGKNQRCQLDVSSALTETI